MTATNHLQPCGCTDCREKQHRILSVPERLGVDFRDWFVDLAERNVKRLIRSRTDYIRIAN